MVIRRCWLTSTVNEEPKWKQIEDFPDYWVSDTGKVFNLKRRYFMNTNINGNFEYVSLTRDGKTSTFGIKKLVAKYHPKIVFVNFHKQHDWKKVPGFPRYIVNWGGMVKDTKDGHTLKHYYQQNGSAFVRLFNHRGAHSRGVRALVLAAFNIRREDAIQLRTIGVGGNRGIPEV